MILLRMMSCDPALGVSFFKILALVIYDIFVFWSDKKSIQLGFVCLPLKYPDREVRAHIC